MKKIIAFLLMLMLFMLQMGCSKQEKAAAPAPAEKAKTEVVKAAEPVVEVNTVEVAANAYFADYPGARIIPTADVFAAIDAEEDIFLLDIRKAEDYAAGHLKGAVNAAWGSPALAEALNWLPDDKPIYVNCYSGQTAGQTNAVLNAAGFNVKSIKYGWKLGIAKTEGFEKYVSTDAEMAPDASGVKLDPAEKKAAMGYFNNLKADPETPSNIIASAKVKEKLDAEEDVVVVSIRKPEDYAKGHIEGAINIPFGKGMQANFTQLPKDKKVLVYCYSGQTAGQTVGIMRLLGYDAASIKSGMGTGGTAGSGWGNEGFPVVQ